MNNPSNRMSMLSPGRLAKRLGLLTATTALVLGVAGVGSAFASQTIELSNPGPYSASTVTNVEVTGTVPSETEFVAVAVCNAEKAAGTHCDKASVSTGESFASLEEFDEGVLVDVRRGDAPSSPEVGWPSFDFTAGPPFSEDAGEPTLCKDKAGSGAQCAIEVSYYHFVGSEVVESSESKDILFKNP